MTIKDLVKELTSGKWTEDTDVIIDPRTGGIIRAVEDDGDEWAGGYVTLVGDYPVKKHMLRDLGNHFRRES